MSAHVAVMAAYVKYTHTNPGVFYFATIITFFPSRPVALVSELGLLGLARHLPPGLLLFHVCLTAWLMSSVRCKGTGADTGKYDASVFI